MRIILVHGWSVFDTATYGGLPERLVSESNAGRLPNVTVQNVWLGQYVSFKDEVRLEDLAVGFEAAFQREVLPNLGPGERFACITHSTGGPVVRQWWWRFYRSQNTNCPMSHLVMLAPANFGSALAQLGKSRLSRLRSWLNSVEPGQGVLDSLEHGSDESWELNRNWILDSAQNPPANDPAAPVFPVVLTGQMIDRKFYDHLNTYTGESGSDGTVRCAAANLNSRYIQLVQNVTAADVTQLDNELARLGGRPDLDAGDFRETMEPKPLIESAATAFRLIRGATHVGSEDGILFSIKDDNAANETVDAIVQSLSVASQADYTALCAKFEKESAQIREKERVEKLSGFISAQTVFHDAFSLVIVRVRDDAGYTLKQFDLKLTGTNDDPSRLPPGFLEDRQQNLVNKSTLTFYFNYDVMNGLDETLYRGSVVRPAMKGINRLGFRMYAYPLDGFVRYYPGILKAARSLFQQVLQPDQSTLIDIQLKRIVGRGIFELPNLNGYPPMNPARTSRNDFRDQKPGDAVNL